MINTKQTIRCAIYTRKSDEDDYRKEQTSLESQRLNCESYAQMHDWEIIPTRYEDYGCTGANMNREGFQQLLNDVREGKIDCILVHKMDRLSRSIADFANVNEFLKKHNVSFVSATEPFDTTCLSGSFMVNILMVFAQQEREETSLRVKDKIHTSKQAGIWAGGHIPFGYKTVNRKLVLDESTAPFARSIFEDYVQGQSIRQIAQRLNTSQLAEKTTFSYRRLLKMIRNPIYKGYIAEGGILYPAQHEALVSEEIWQQANDRVDPMPWYKPNPNQQEALLKGVVRCKECNKSMSPHHVHGRGGKKHCYYTCLNKMDGTGCKGLNTNMRQGLIDNLVIQEVRKILKNPSSFIGLQEYCEQYTKNRHEAWRYLSALEDVWDTLQLEQYAVLVRSLLKNVWVRKDAVMIQFTTAGLKNILGDQVLSSKEILYEVSLPQPTFSHKRKTQAPLSPKIIPTQIFPTVRHALLQAQDWIKELNSEKYSSMEDFAQHYQCTAKTIRFYIRRFFRLSPKVKEAILNDTFDSKYSISDVIYKKIPEDWHEQEKMFGLA